MSVRKTIFPLCLTLICGFGILTAGCSNNLTGPQVQDQDKTVQVSTDTEDDCSDHNTSDEDGGEDCSGGGAGHNTGF